MRTSSYPDYSFTDEDGQIWDVTNNGRWSVGNITLKDCVAHNNKGGNYRINGVTYDTMEEANAALLAATMRPKKRTSSDLISGAAKLLRVMTNPVTNR